MATCGLTAGAQEVYDCAKNALDSQDRIVVDRVGCIGACFLEPIMEVFKDGKRTTYVHMDAEKTAKVCEKHVLGDQIVEKFTIGGENSPEDCKGVTSVEDAVFYKAQTRVVLRKCGLIDPEDIRHYILLGGYSALAKVLDFMSPEEVISEVKYSGLRGRGGAGFPSGIKWQFTAEATSPDGIKYTCCNADEGDPGAFMDRSVLESDPFSIIEAMTIAAFAIDSHEGYIYIRAEYPLAVERLNKAISQAEECGLLGDNILGTHFNFNLGLRLGAGAFVCGEETALLTSIEGNRGEPSTRPPFPAVKGLFGKPTLLNNVETYANITWIILNSGKAFSEMGTNDSKGTKVFALGGKVKQAGLVEVEMGTTLRTIVEKVGGGVPHDKKFKAAQTGGPSGGCVPGNYIDIPIDYAKLIEIGSMMGSGGLIVMDEDNCMVDIAKFFLNFVVDESCGKCVPCRIGTRKLYDLLAKITKGQSTEEDLATIEELAYHLKSSSLCALGQSAPNAVISTMSHFMSEYEAHVKEHKCPAMACKGLLEYKIDLDTCNGCHKCAKNCPSDAISGALQKPHVIDLSKCSKCGACMENCNFGAVSRG
ncbi:MAG: NADH-quinone oxidoreductase subunit NuoF [Eggerthellaceae bacterium]|nr:NADH-quinone oxidoreductase subunit NuoF [Eggerthellaceae bacterium]